MRYEIAESGAPGDEHLLERISVLENRLARLAERLERLVTTPDSNGHIAAVNLIGPAERGSAVSVPCAESGSAV